MSQKFRGALICSIGVVLVAATGCSRTPDPHFEKALQAQQAGPPGDPYAALRVPSTENFPHQRDPKTRAAMMTQVAILAASNYQNLVTTLEADKEIKGAPDLVASCRKVFAEAVGFQPSEKLNAQSVAAAARPLFDRLTACRDQAIAAQKNNASRDAATVMRRFASAGMGVVATTTVAVGDEPNGMEMWTRASELYMKDRPGFKFSITNFFFSRQ